eukprot:415929_1
MPSYGICRGYPYNCKSSRHNPLGNKRNTPCDQWPQPRANRHPKHIPSPTEHTEEPEQDHTFGWNFTDVLKSAWSTIVTFIVTPSHQDIPTTTNNSNNTYTNIPVTRDSDNGLTPVNAVIAIHDLLLTTRLSQGDGEYLHQQLYRATSMKSKNAKLKQRHSENYSSTANKHTKSKKKYVNNAKYTPTSVHNLSNKENINRLNLNHIKIRRNKANSVVSYGSEVSQHLSLFDDDEPAFKFYATKAVTNANSTSQSPSDSSACVHNYNNTQVPQNAGVMQQEVNVVVQDEPLRPSPKVSTQPQSESPPLTSTSSTNDVSTQTQSANSTSQSPSDSSAWCNNITNNKYNNNLYLANNITNSAANNNTNTTATNSTLASPDNQDDNDIEMLDVQQIKSNFNKPRKSPSIQNKTTPKVDKNLHAAKRRKEDPLSGKSGRKIWRAKRRRRPSKPITSKTADNQGTIKTTDNCSDLNLFLKNLSI